MFVRIATAASLPIIVAVVVALARGWTPVGDSAILAIRAHDVLRGHPPLVGMETTAHTISSGLAADHPGPLEVWVLALPYWLLGPAGLLVTTALVNIASVVTAVGVAWRRGGRVLATTVAGAVVVLCWFLGPTVIRDPLNTHVGLLPVFALVLLCWDVRLGRFRSVLPATAIACWITQAHVVYLPVTAVLVIGTAVLVLLDPVRRHDDSGRWLAWGGLGALVAYAPVLADQVNGSGNLGHLAHLAGSPGEGWGAAVRVLVRSLGFVPAWARPHNGPFLVLEQPLTGDWLLALATLAGLVWLQVDARRRRDRAARGLLEVASLGVVAIAVVALRIPRGGAILAADAMLLLWPLTALVWVAIGWAGYRSWTAGTPVRSLSRTATVSLDALALACLAGLVVANTSALPRFGGFGEELMDPIGQIEQPVRLATADDHVVQVNASGWAARLYARPAVMADLERRGTTTRTGERDRPSRRGGPGAPDPTTTLWIVSGPTAGRQPVPGSRLVIRIELVPGGIHSAAAGRRRRLRSEIQATDRVVLRDGPRVSAATIRSESFHFDREPTGGDSSLPASWISIETFVDLHDAGLIASPSVDADLLRQVRRDDLGRYFASGDMVLSVWQRDS